jgi:hypothetical protein
MLKCSSLCLYSSNLGTFWLKIEQFWPFEEISIFSNGGHLGYRTAELFNIYYWIFYELWTFTDFDRFCKLEKRGDEIKKNLLLWNYNRRTHFWKRTSQWLFHQNFVVIEQMVSDKKIFMGIFHRVLCLKLLSQSQPNFAEMILGWSSSKNMSSISELRPRWPPQPKLI